ncbi:AraC family transcriptional regulator [Cellulomonas sp. zg-ZUI22]|uniref:AraC family transcriptional regulator n=1 Tax=Cellulomonas sp. zg-ZUI22 TaxID=2816955 RepID=UPI001A93CB09|nr:AraC family transcriptional regulator [Cellulomonas sp. zg-ZUI22]MBO0899849.1 AraC family transcriptional regulator [Cellulomonas sp. zg-ZUI22]
MSLVIAPPRPAPDAVGEALHRLRVAGVFYCRTEAAGPWAVDMPAFGDCLTFHVVTQGEVWVDVAGAPPLRLGAGELALVPHGRGHLLASDLAAPSLGRVDLLPQEYVTESYSVLRHEGRGDRTQLVCGVLTVDGPAARPLLDLLPAVLHVPASVGAPWVARTLELMTAELAQLRPGGEAVLTRLADVLVVQAVRAWLDAQEPTDGWLGALRDPDVGAALAAVHRDPARPWTVAALAREVAMSRSAFAARFTQVVGMPAMQYVATWRMHVAADRLARGDGVAQAAAAAGYESAAAFSRAFTRTTGRSPGSVRRDGGRVPR